MVMLRLAKHIYSLLICALGVLELAVLSFGAFPPMLPACLVFLATNVVILLRLELSKLVWSEKGKEPSLNSPSAGAVSL